MTREARLIPTTARLHSSNAGARFGLVAAGAALLFGYAVAVNAPPWNFGKLLGVCVSLFFAVAQAISCLVFRVRPDMPILVSGAFIIAGGLVITFWPT